jgi:predicted permease
MVFWGMDGALLGAYWPVALAPVVVLSVSGAAGYLMSRRVLAHQSARGAFVVSSMFSNVGSTMGGFLCLLYLGDKGLIVSQLYLLSSIPYYFTAVFTVARGFAGGERRTVWQALRANFSDPIAALPLTGMAVGLSLGLAGVPLPIALEIPRRVFVFVAVIMFALSFGLTAQVRLMVKRIRDYLAILPVKFVVAPLAGLAFVLVAGYSLTSNPLAFKVVIIQSMMPVAIWSVVAAKLFRLDDHLALGAWIFTTLSLSPLVPLIGWIARL